MMTLSGQGSIKGKHRFFPSCLTRNILMVARVMAHVKTNQTFEGSHMGRLTNMIGLVLALPAVDAIAGTGQVRFELSHPEGL